MPGAEQMHQELPWSWEHGPGRPRTSAQPTAGLLMDVSIPWLPLSFVHIPSIWFLPPHSLTVPAWSQRQPFGSGFFSRGLAGSDPVWASRSWLFASVGLRSVTGLHLLTSRHRSNMETEKREAKINTFNLWVDDIWSIIKI